VTQDTGTDETLLIFLSQTGTYTVRVTLTFGAASQEALDVIVQQVQSGSLVSDIQCAGGGPSTSIMQAPSASNNYLHC